MGSTDREPGAVCIIELFTAIVRSNSLTALGLREAVSHSRVFQVAATSMLTPGKKEGRDRGSKEGGRKGGEKEGREGGRREGGEGRGEEKEGRKEPIPLKMLLLLL